MTQEPKVALVTGASRGIGAAIAQQLIQDGYFVVGTATSEAVAEKLSAQFADNGAGKVLDVRDGAAIDALVTDIEQNYGPVLALVNNAGITKDQLAMAMTPADFAQVINVNLNGTFNVTQPIFKKMIRQRHGAIVNMSSVIGLMGNMGQTNYAASKAGIIGFTKSLAKEGARRGIRVNAIAPGYVMTDILKTVPQDLLDKFAAMTMLGRLGQPEEIAKVALFLASEDAYYITGQVIEPNGGMRL